MSIPQDEFNSLAAVSRGPDECPYCNRAFEVAAVDIHFLRGISALFACPDCGLAKPSFDEARRKLTKRPPVLERVLWKLKYRPGRS
jgi:hypothetical protein